MSHLRLINPEVEFLRYSRRLEIAGGGAALLFLILLARFVWLQIMQFDHYHALAENNRISLVPAPPSRGVIYDRQGLILAQNFSAYTLEVTPDKVANLDETIAQLSQVVNIEAGDRRRFKRLLEESKNFESIPVRNRLTVAEVAHFTVNRYRFPGVEVKARLFRQYPLGVSFSHVVGYIGRIGQHDLDRLKADEQLANYRGTDHIGKLGIEATYESWLHGHTGIEKVETDSGGRAVRLLSRTAPQSGHDLYLQLDAKLQQVAEMAFGDYRGALVALDPRNGGVLALVSRPGFDPNLFVDGIDSGTWHELNNARERPLINRALRAVYPPGSTIKPFMALAGLEAGVRRAGDTIADPGYFTLPGSSHRYRDWKKGGHGMVDMKRAIVVSCDTYFYGLAQQMGISRMSAFLSQFGFGRKSGIDLDGELAGLMPTPDWKRKRYKQPWWPGETVIAGIGQGYVLATPMQLAVATMAIANDGVVYKPQIIRAWREPGTGQVSYAAPQAVGHIAIGADALRLVKDAMVEVTQPGGTASVAGSQAAYLFAGKTGTAQVVGIRQGEKYDASRIGAQNRDHALFIGFAPADDPKIVVAVMVENGGHGGSTAAPVARKVIDYWLLGKLPTATVLPAPEVVAPEEVEDAAPADETVAPVLEEVAQ